METTTTPTPAPADYDYVTDLRSQNGQADFVFGLPYMVQITCQESGLRDTSAADGFTALASLSYEKARVAALVPEATWLLELSYRPTLHSPRTVMVTIRQPGSSLMEELRWQWENALYPQGGARGQQPTPGEYSASSFD